jgi:hypothetical protein
MMFRCANSCSIPLRTSRPADYSRVVARYLGIPHERTDGAVPIRRLLQAHEKVMGEGEEPLPISSSYININSILYFLFFLQQECSNPPFTFTLHTLHVGG